MPSSHHHRRSEPGARTLLLLGLAAALVAGCAAPLLPDAAQTSDAQDRAERQLRDYLKSRPSTPLTDYANQRWAGIEPRSSDLRMVEISGQIHIVDCASATVIGQAVAAKPAASGPGRVQDR